MMSEHSAEQEIVDGNVPCRRLSTFYRQTTKRIHYVRNNINNLYFMYQTFSYFRLDACGDNHVPIFLPDLDC